MSIHAKLAEDFLNPKSTGGFSGVKNLSQLHKEVSRKVVNSYLCTEDAYNLHKFTRRKFLRRKVSAPYCNYLWQADLIQADKLAHQNKGYKFILTIIDVASRYAYARCIRHKTGEEITSAFKSVINQNNKPKYLQVDEGKEFCNAMFKKFLVENYIIMYSCMYVCSNCSEFKACVVERFNGTLLNKIYTNTSRIREQNPIT